jgi:hypothetical protein
LVLEINNNTNIYTIKYDEKQKINSLIDIFSLFIIILSLQCVISQRHACVTPPQSICHPRWLPLLLAENSMARYKESDEIFQKI